MSQRLSTQYLGTVVKKNIIFCDKIKAWFKHAFKAGISFGKDDLIIPKQREPINNTKNKLKSMRNTGRTNQGEKYNKL